MARLVTGKLMGDTHQLDPRELALARKKLEKARRSNPLRRVQLECCGWVQDPIAQKRDRVWCDHCSDWATVGAVAE